jgi:hypothetical protein
MFFKITPLHGPHGKRRSIVESWFTELLHGNGHGADPQKTSYVELTVAEQRTKNIPPVVACASATEGCLQVVA